MAAESDSKTIEFVSEQLSNMNIELINYQCLKHPLSINIVYGGQQISYDLILDDRDIKHILIYLLFNQLTISQTSTIEKRFSFKNLHPSIKELSKLYNIKSDRDFRLLLMQMARNQYSINSIEKSPMKSYPSHILYNYGKKEENQNESQSRIINTLKITKGNRKHMTSYELDRSIKRTMDLEARQQSYSTFDERKRNVDKDELQNDKLIEDNIGDEQEIDINRVGTNIGGKITIEDIKGDENKKEDDILSKIKERWDGNIMNSLRNEKYIGGDWRLRMGISSNPLQSLDTENEVNKQWKEQLREGLQYTVKNRYRQSPYTIKGLPFDEFQELKIDYRNIRLLNKFVNSRGMILPRRLTGIDIKHQKKIARAIKRARVLGFMPFRSKLLILDKREIRNKVKQNEMKRVVQSEEEMDAYDPITKQDLHEMYPEYENYHFEEDTNDDNLELFDFKKVYEIDDEELERIDNENHTNDHAIFLRELKQDIMLQIPEYWKKRMEFRSKI